MHMQAKKKNHRSVINYQYSSKLLGAQWELGPQSAEH